MPFAFFDEEPARILKPFVEVRARKHNERDDDQGHDAGSGKGDQGGAHMMQQEAAPRL